MNIKKDMSYKLYAVIINENHKVIRVQILEVEYEYNTALKCVDYLMNTRNQNAKFGSLDNPLRYEAANIGGIAERF